MVPDFQSLSADGHIDCFHVLAKMNRVIVNMETQVSLTQLYLGTYIQRLAILKDVGSVNLHRRFDYAFQSLLVYSSS